MPADQGPSHHKQSDAKTAPSLFDVYQALEVILQSFENSWMLKEVSSKQTNDETWLLFRFATKAGESAFAGSRILQSEFIGPIRWMNEDSPVDIRHSDSESIGYVGALKEALRQMTPENQPFAYFQIRQDNQMIQVQRKIVLDQGIRGNPLFQVDLDAKTGKVLRRSFPHDSLYDESTKEDQP